MLFIFALMIGQLPVFAFFSLRQPSVLSHLLLRPRIMALTAMEDQVMGGVVMKARQPDRIGGHFWQRLLPFGARFRGDRQSRLSAMLVIP